MSARGFDDCILTQAEIEADAEAAAMAQAFAETQAAALGIPVEDIIITGIEASDGMGCSQMPHAASEIQVATDTNFVLALGSGNFLDDCYISPEEIASDPEAQAFADAFIATQAAALGVDPNDIDVSGISTDGDNLPGCDGGFGRRLQQTSGNLRIQFNTAAVAHGYARALLKQQKHFVSKVTLK